MEVHAMAMVLAMLLARGVAGEEEEEEEKRGSRQQRTCSTSWTLSHCNRAPQGWRLLQLAFPWLALLVLCMPCLGVAGQSMSIRNTGASLHLLADGVWDGDQEARPVTCYPVNSDLGNSATESDGSSDTEKLSATSFEAGNAELSRSSETGMLLDLLAGEEFAIAACTLPGWNYVLTTTLQFEASAEIIVQDSAREEQSVGVRLDWGSNSLTSVSLKFLTLVNGQANKELKVFNIFTTNTQFCTVDFREAVISPGNELSIPIAYFVNTISKTEGFMLLQTSAGSFRVETLGEGTPSLYPLLGIMGISKSELRETVSFFNPFDESIFVEEAYVWVEFSNKKVSPSHQVKSEGGVLCKRYDCEPESSYPSWLKVRSKPEWFLAPHSLSPIMDLSIMVDDGKHVVGTLFFKILQHSVESFEVLVVPMEMEWVPMDACDAKPLANKNIVELAVFLETEKQNGWVRFPANSNLQVGNVSTKGPSDDGLITISVENIILKAVMKSLFCLSEESYLVCKLNCLADLSMANKLIAHFNSTGYLALTDLCSVLLFYGVSRGANVDEKRCLASLFKCAEGVYCHNCFDRPSASCKVEDGFFNRKNVIGFMLIHGHDPDSRHFALEYNAGDFTELTKPGNKQGNKCDPLKKLMAEGFVVLSPFVPNPKSVCAWPKTMLESRISSTYSWILDSGVVMVTRTSAGSSSIFHRGTIQQHDHPLSKKINFNILYMMQESNMKEMQKSGCIATYRIGLVDFADYGSEYSGKKLSIVVDLLESDFLEETVAEDCVEAQSVHILAVLSPRFCNVLLPFSRHRKLLLKLSCLMLFSITFILIIKVLRQEKQAASDFRPRHSCSYTLFSQFVCLKTGHMKASESAEHTVESSRSLECQNDNCSENRLGCRFRSFFDSHAMVYPHEPSMEQTPAYLKTSGLMADQKNCKMGSNSVEKPDEASTSPPLVRVAAIHPVTEDMALTRSVLDIEKVHCKERKEKGKRRKRRSNIIDLKQESEKMGQSGSSSPPSSPASPATPIAYSSISPFLHSGPFTRSLKGSSHSGGHLSNSLRDTTTHRSMHIQFSSESLSQLDIRADHTCNSATASKGRLQQLYTLGSKASLEPLPTRTTAAVKTGFSGIASVRNNSRKDISPGENWAAVARRAVASSSEANRWQGPSTSPSRFTKNDGIRNKPVLLPWASFPQSGRSMQWNPQMPEEISFSLSDPMSSPSLISTSLVAPNARAPGSRPANRHNEKLPVNNLREAASGLLEVGSTVTSADSRMDAFLYDIWGDHFAGLSCRTQTDLFSSDVAPEHTSEVTSPAFPEVGSLFTSSDLMTSTSTPGSSDARSISIPAAGFSVFSCDTFFPPCQPKDAAGSSTP